MSNPDDTQESPHERSLTDALLKLRMHDGLTVAHLQRDRRNAAALLSLPAVEQLVAKTGTTAPQATHELVRRGLMTLADPTHRIVGDATLAFGIYADVYLESGIADRTVLDLKSDSLGRRREALLGHWQRLHEAFGSSAGAAPSDRTLRETVELRVFRELARKLANVETVAHLIASPAPRRVTGRVIVIGGAVMDAIFRGKRIPQLETSERAHDFTLSPGGKGFTQAIAAKRLGLELPLPFT